ncbi:hypothetical protein HYV30_00210 [Candidatus Kaiserbacteria bacterium]|nr:hypothetical protein [Candidatus Kaiserbacteria bacterium]
MTQDEMFEVKVADLWALRQAAERATQNIEDLEGRLRAEHEARGEAVKRYGARRVELVEQEMRKRGLTYCTRCFCMIYSAEADFVLTEGRETYDGAYHTYGFRNFFRFYRVCPACREKLLDAHGRRGGYDTFAKDQAYFHAFHVEKRLDGFWVRKFGAWGHLGWHDDKCVLAELPGKLVEQLAAEWGLPPRISFESEYFGGPMNKLVIHEHSAAAAH